MILIIDTVSSKIRLSADGREIDAEPASQAAALPALCSEFLGEKKPGAIGVVIGPGSFTGIRLGIAFAKGLAVGWNIPLVGLSVFDLAGDGAVSSGRGDWFICENGACRIAAGLPPGAKIITDYDLSAGERIVRDKTAAAENAGVALPSVIPLYIRPSYVG